MLQRKTPSTVPVTIVRTLRDPTYPDDSYDNITLMVDGRVHTRLNGTCFRPANVQKAGNFLTWRNPQQVLEAVKNDLRLTIVEDLNTHFENHSEFPEDGVEGNIEIEMKEPIGWSSTDDRRKYLSEDLEPFALNPRATALRVMLKKGHRAPLTNLLTIHYRIKKSRNQEGYIAFINTMYPGEDIGRLEGDITEQVGVVFFGWEHPGEFHFTERPAPPRRRF